ncbi:3-deoxy-D-manno-octulosonic acid transferase [Joostella sp. CR20]|uniref:3-deoxy-D-manno-octulosonic acid transferase n=1 Tax=Joostella sp. CR20 TaxID=2804312 RepID=UPI00313ECE2F
MFSSKLRLFVDGRKTVFNFLAEQISPTDRVIWFHTASLGEFEQGLPVIEQTKKDFPKYKILVTFFSPSGYEVKKNTSAADVVCYLPLDTKRNAKRFLKCVNPEIAIFVKYEFWPNYLSVLKNKQIPTLLISGVFRENQVFFKWYGGFMRNALNAFDHFFVQDENSKQLLNTINISNVTVSGDTRFDRVAEILERNNTLNFVETFKNQKLCLVAGSTWPEDEVLLIEYINNDTLGKLKYIIAPHNIKSVEIQKLKKSLNKKVVLYSEMNETDISTYDVLILDTIGILTKVYSYADLAYVGGGMGTTGLHNTLEPAVFGIPVIIGKNYDEFLEAKELVKLGGVISVKNANQFKEEINYLLDNQKVFEEKSSLNKNFIVKNKGAKIQIGCYIRKLIK